MSLFILFRIFYVMQIATGELLFPTHTDLEHLAMMSWITETKLSERMHIEALRPYREKHAAKIERGRSGLSSEVSQSRSV